MDPRGTDSTGSPRTSPWEACQAALDPIIRDIVLQVNQSTVRGFPRPFLNLSVDMFAAIMDDAFGRTLMSPFDPHENSVNYHLASYLIPYVSLTGYIGANPKLQGTYSKRLVAGLLGIESGQVAVIRALLYDRADMPVDPYDVMVSDFPGLHI